MPVMSEVLDRQPNHVAQAPQQIHLTRRELIVGTLSRHQHLSDYLAVFGHGNQGDGAYLQRQHVTHRP